MTPGTLDDKIIQFHLFAIDKYQRHKVVGESEMRVGDVDLRMPIKMWLNLRDIDDVSTLKTDGISCYGYNTRIPHSAIEI